MAQESETHWWPLYHQQKGLLQPEGDCFQGPERQIAGLVFLRDDLDGHQQLELGDEFLLFAL